ncbi:MAG: helix-turn-helix transcriptional regulator [Pseudomonadota bacterium]
MPITKHPITKLLKEYQVSTRTLAKAMGKSLVTVSRLMRGHQSPKVRDLQAIKEVTGASYPEVLYAFGIDVTETRHQHCIEVQGSIDAEGLITFGSTGQSLTLSSVVGDKTSTALIINAPDHIMDGVVVLAEDSSPSGGLVVAYDASGGSRFGKLVDKEKSAITLLDLKGNSHEMRAIAIRPITFVGSSCEIS